MKRIAQGLIVAGLLGFASAPALAVDGVAMEAGQRRWHRHGTRRDPVGLGKRWLQGQGWHLGGYWDLGLGYWKRDDVRAGQNDDIAEIGLTPVFRLQQNDLAGLYGEIGDRVAPAVQDLARRQALQHQLPVRRPPGRGLPLRRRKARSISRYRYQHLSNGGIKQPNDGINFNQIRLQYHF